MGTPLALLVTLVHHLTSTHHSSIVPSWQMGRCPTWLAASGFFSGRVIHAAANKPPVTPKAPSSQSPGTKKPLSGGQLSTVPPGPHGLTVHSKDAPGPGPRSWMGWHRIWGPLYGSLGPPRISGLWVVLTLDSGAGFTPPMGLHFCGSVPLSPLYQLLVHYSLLFSSLFSCNSFLEVHLSVSLHLSLAPDIQS